MFYGILISEALSARRRVLPFAVARLPRPGQSRPDAWGWGAGVVPELGFGITECSASRRFIIAPDIRGGFFPNIRFSLAVGFTP